MKSSNIINILAFFFELHFTEKYFKLQLTLVIEALFTFDSAVIKNPIQLYIPQ